MNTEGELLDYYVTLLNQKDQMERDLDELRREIHRISRDVATVIESIGDSITRDGWTIGFKTWRSVKLEEGADRNFVAQQLKAEPSTAYLVEEKFNLNSVSSHYISEENSPCDLPRGLLYSEVVALHPVKSNRKPKK